MSFKVLVIITTDEGTKLVPGLEGDLLQLKCVLETDDEGLARFVAAALTNYTDDEVEFYKLNGS